jgi:hypothetical protein
MKKLHPEFRFFGFSENAKINSNNAQCNFQRIRGMTNALARIRSFKLGNHDDRRNGLARSTAWLT